MGSWSLSLTVNAIRTGILSLVVTTVAAQGGMASQGAECITHAPASCFFFGTHWHTVVGSRIGLRGSLEESRFANVNRQIVHMLELRKG